MQILTIGKLVELANTKLSNSLPMCGSIVQQCVNCVTQFMMTHLLIMMQIKTRTRVKATQNKTRMIKAAIALPTAMASSLTRLLAVSELPSPSDSVAVCRQTIQTFT